MALIEPDPAGSGLPAMRIAGFALLGVAAVATVIGLGTLATEGNTTAAPTSGRRSTSRNVMSTAGCHVEPDGESFRSRAMLLDLAPLRGSLRRPAAGPRSGMSTQARS